MVYNIGDKVMANRKPPVMTVAEIIGKKAFCRWREGQKRRAKMFFLTELRLVAEPVEPIEEQDQDGLHHFDSIGKVF